MEKCDELENEEYSEKDEETTNLTFMALTSSEVESDSNFCSKSEEEDEVFLKLSRSNLITFVQEHMGIYQDKSRNMKMQKK